MRHTSSVLSFEINSELTSQLKDLSSRYAVAYESFKSWPADMKQAIHRDARVSIIGASTRIENAVLTDAEVHWVDTVLEQDGRSTTFQEKRTFIENKLSKDKERSIEEVAGCRNMLFLIYEQYQNFFPLTETILRGLHQELLQFYPPAHYYLGKYKTVTNSVVERNSKTGAERVVFKTADPGPLTEASMKDLVAWYNENKPHHPWSIAVACEFVFRFLAIHPFQDGNGRLGRGLFLLALLQSTEEALSQLARYIAVDRHIERHKQEYYLVLQRCSGGLFQPDPKSYRIDYFLKFMIKILNESLEDLAVYQKRYLTLQKLSDSALKVFSCFKESPERRLQTREILELVHLPRRTITHTLNTLLQNGLIQRYGQGAGTRYQIVF